MDRRAAAHAAAHPVAAATRSSWCPTASPTSTSASDGGIEVKRPASGLVTAVEPVMRACSGTWIAHGSGSADREVVDARRPRARAARPGRLLAAPHLAHRRGGAGLLLRLRQRRHVAAVPRGPCAAGVPRIRLGGLPGRQPALCRRGGGRGAQRRPGGAGAGLPLRAAAGDDPREAAAGHHPHLLAHPLAQPGVVRHLPLAARDPAKACWAARSSGFHTRFHCKNFIETVDRYLEARIEHEHSTIAFRDEGDAGGELPDLHRVAERRPSAADGPRWRVPRNA